MTAEIKAKITSLRERGLTKSEISSQLGIPPVKVARILLKSGVRLTPEQILSNRPRKYSKEQKEKVLVLHHQGMGVEEIVVKTGVAEGSVRYYCASDSVPKKQTVSTQEKSRDQLSKEAIELRESGCNIKEISGKLGVPWRTVTFWCRRAGIKLPTGSLGGQNNGSAQKAINNFLCSSERFSHIANEKGGEYLGPIGYVPVRQRVAWKCSRGHVFETVPYYVIRGNWCPICGRSVSTGEKELYDFILSLIPEAISRDRNVLAPKEIDIFLPTRKIGIEYNGLHWHGELYSEDKYNTLVKHRLAKKAGIRLITVFEDEWKTRRLIVENYLKGILGARRRVGARKLTIRKGCFKGWVEYNHLQGAANGTDYGLWNGDELLAVATFAKPNISKGRKSEEGVWELARYCVGLIGVTGGLSKLMSEFKKDHPEAKELISYSDNRWSTGNLYESSGFTKVRENRPCYWYFIDGKNTNRIHRFGLRKQILIKKGGNPNKTEWQLAQEAGYDRIWDAGTTLWSKILKPSSD